MTFSEKFMLWRRYIAFLIDFLIPCGLLLIVCDLLFFKLIRVEDDSIVYSIWGIAVAIALITKDIFGKSLGKRILGLKIVSWYGYEQPRLYQLILRNILIFLIPIEAIFVVIRKDHMRIGDHMAETKVISKNENR